MTLNFDIDRVELDNVDFFNFNLTLKPVKPIINKFEFNESPDIEEMTKLLKYPNIFTDVREYEKLKEYNNLILNGEKINYIKKKSKTDDDDEIKQFKFGRRYATKLKGLQGFTRKTRSHIARNKYFDVDIENALPSILNNKLISEWEQVNKELQKLKLNTKCDVIIIKLNKIINNKKFDALNKLHIDRETIYKLFDDVYKINGVNKQEMLPIIKKFYVALINGASIDKFFTENKILLKKTATEDQKRQLDLYNQNFKQEIDIIHDIIYNTNNNIVESLEKYYIDNHITKNIYEIKNAVLCCWYFEIESRILDTVIKYLTHNKLISNNNIVLIFDGFYLLNEDFKTMTDKIELIKNLKKLIYETFNIDITYTIKPIKDTYTEEDFKQAEEEINKQDIEDDDDTQETGDENTEENNLENDTGDKNNNLNNNNLSNALFNLINGNLDHHNTAEFYQKYIEPDRYIYTEKRGWYEYNNYNILEIKGEKPPTNLIKNLPDLIKKLCNKELKNLKNPKTTMKNYENYKKLYDLKIKCLDNAKKKIGNSSFINAVIGLLRGFYKQEDIIDKLDKAHNVIAFRDGYLYDVKEGNFRKILKNDYITKNIKRQAPRYIISDNKLNVINDFLNSLQDTPEKVNYLINILSLAIFTKKHQHLYIFTGGGSNGKTLLMNLYNEMLGNEEYYIQGENNFLTSTIKAGAPNSTLAQCRGVRVLVISEPNEDERGKSELNMPNIKNYTGNEPITTRNLNEKTFTYKPQFNTFLLCNDIPGVNRLDYGTKRRLKIIKFPFRFVNKKDIVNENDREANKELENEIKSDTELLDAFLIILLKKAHEIYNYSSLDEPEEFNDALNEYFEDNNPVKNFIDENYFITNDDKDRILTSVLHSQYMETGAKMDKKIFRKFITDENIKIIKSSGKEYYTGILRQTDNIIYKFIKNETVKDINNKIKNADLFELFQRSEIYNFEQIKDTAKPTEQKFYSILELMKLETETINDTIYYTNINTLDTTTTQ